MLNISIGNLLNCDDTDRDPELPPAADHKGEVLVVGGSRGLGRSIALELRRRGHRVTILARSATVASMTSGIDIIQADITDSNIAASVLDRLQPREVYLCAGVGCYGDISRWTAETTRVTVRTNFEAIIEWLRLSITSLAPGSRVAWTSSLTARVPSAEWAVYAACKAGVEHFIHCVRNTAQERGVSISLCLPGPMRTSFHASAGAPSPIEAALPEEIAIPLINAVKAGVLEWVAPRDRGIIEQIETLPRKEARNIGGLV